MIEVLTGDLGALAGKLARLIVGRVWDPVSATSRAGQLPDMFRRGRPLLLQGAASTLADRLGAALEEYADTAGDGGLLGRTGRHPGGCDHRLRGYDPPAR